MPLNGPVMECLKGLNQVGARLRWEEDGRILCQGGEPDSGYNKSILDKVVHGGDDPFNLYLMLFQMVTRPARLKIIGESGLKFVDLAPIRHFLPLLGARLTSVVPGNAQFSDELLPGINVVAAATLLAMPAFVGGSVKLSGRWEATGDARSGDAVKGLFSKLGVNLSVADGELSASFGEGIAEGEPLPSPNPIDDLTGLPSALLPLGLALSLIPAGRA